MGKIKKYLIIGFGLVILIAGILVLPKTTSSDIVTGLVGYWKFDDGAPSPTAADSSGNGNTGTLTNGPTWTTGQVNGALKFDGTDDYVNVLDSDSLDLPNQVTMSAWVKSSSTSRMSVVNKSYSDYEMGFENANVQAWYGNSAGWKGLSWTAPSTLADGNWHHLAVFINKATGVGEAWVDGSSLGTKSNTPSTGNYNQPLRIGARNSASNRFNGTIDEVRVYNRALTLAEIRTLADATSPTISLVSSSTTTSSATITWTTNENSDSQVEYGLTAAYGSQTTLNPARDTSHLVLVSGLSPATLYHYRVKSRDEAGNLATSGDYTFTTQAVIVTNPPVYVRSGGASGKSTTLDIGPSGNDRLVVVIAGREATGASTYLTGVTVAGKNCNFVARADNPSGGNYQEMWYCDDDDLGSSSGVVTIALVGGPASGWAIHAHLYTGANQGGPSDFGVDQTSVSTTTVTVTGIDVPENGLVVMGAGNGSSGSWIGWTSPLTERTDGPNPSSAVLGTASGIELSAQTNKTYIATASGAFNRGTGIVAVWTGALAPPAPTENNVSGWAWSGGDDGVYAGDGWISFKGSTYGVHICTSNSDTICAAVSSPKTGKMIGYAWSGSGRDESGNNVAMLGWLNFAPAQAPPAAPNYSACVDLPGITTEPCNGVGNYKVTGWARFEANGGGWDGWVKLGDDGTWASGDKQVWVDTSSGPPYEVRGWAWGGGSGAGVVSWISFNCLDRGVCANSNYKVIANIDFPPVVTCNDTEIWPDPCIDSRNPKLTWTYSDPESEPQSAYQVQVDNNSGFSSPEITVTADPSSSTEYQITGTTLNWATTYYWHIRVRDSVGNWSDWCSPYGSFSTRPHAYPNVNFSWSPTKPSAGENTKFTDQSTCYDDVITGSNCTKPDDSFSWIFTPVLPNTGTTIWDLDEGNILLNEELIVSFSNEGEWDVKLEVTDGAPTNYMCPITKRVKAYLPLPSWKEVIPRD